jgi:hypothetical protein
MTKQLEFTEIKRAWLDNALSQFNLMSVHGNFTADDLHDKLPCPQHPNWWGILVNRLSRKGVIRFVGYTKAARKERNGGVVRIWEKCL